MPVLRVKWVVRVAWYPDGGGEALSSSAQMLEQRNDFGQGGGSIIVPGGVSPTAANIAAAMATVGVNAAAAFSTPTNLAVINGWQNGTG